MKIVEAYSHWAGNYDTDRNLTRDLDQIVTAGFLADRQFSLTVEAGCGTGKNTPQFAAVSEAVLALDFSQAMLEHARQRIGDSKVRFVQTDLTAQWPCDSGCAQLVSFNLVLEHIEDLGHVLREAARVLLPGGIVLINEFHPFRQYQGGKARFVDATAETVHIDAYTHHASEFFAAATAVGLRLESLDEHWHVEDVGKPPRLISMVWAKSAGPETLTKIGTSEFA